MPRWDRGRSPDGGVQARRTFTSRSPSTRRTSTIRLVAATSNEQVAGAPADPQPPDRGLADERRQVRGGQLELAAVGVGSQPEQGPEAGTSGAAADHACGEHATGYGTGRVGRVTLEAAEQLGQPERREPLRGLENRRRQSIRGSRLHRPP